MKKTIKKPKKKSNENCMKKIMKILRKKQWKIYKKTMKILRFGYWICFTFYLISVGKTAEISADFYIKFQWIFTLNFSQFSAFFPCFFKLFFPCFASLNSVALEFTVWQGQMVWWLCMFHLLEWACTCSGFNLSQCNFFFIIHSY